MEWLFAPNVIIDCIKGDVKTINRTRIEWCDYSWNPNGQGCPHKCWYCYAMKGARRNYFMHLALYKKGKRKNPPCELCRDFVPHFHPERLKQPWEVKKPSKVFVDSTADLFADEMKLEWTAKIFDSMLWCPVKHIFQMLTKKPQNINKLVEFPDNWWFGVTVSTQQEIWRIDELRQVHCKIHFVSFEPLLGYVQPDLNGIQWVIIGKLTGSRKVKLNMGWVMDISAQCSRLKIPIFLKNNLGLPIPRQEFPEVQP